MIQLFVNAPLRVQSPRLTLEFLIFGRLIPIHIQHSYYVQGGYYVVPFGKRTLRQNHLTH